MLTMLLVLSTIAILGLLTRSVVVLRRHADWIPSSAAGAPLPTVTVCIAARNETHALAQCLERVLKSEYQKIEILVLDDSSSDDTSLIIKSFATAGIRFIAGKQLPAGWLGKNHAYQTLADEASGDLLLYVDVDTHITPSTIANLVRKFSDPKIAMLSVLPRRDDGLRISAVFGTMRYYWELLFGTKESPPAASALWMVRADALARDGIGLANYGLSVRPERHLARQLTKDSSYKYVIGTKDIGVTYEKHMKSQHETAIRLYYPATGRKVFLWLAASLFLVLLIVPLAVILSWQWNQFSLTWSLMLIGLIASTFGMFVRRTYGSDLWPLRIFFGPLLVLQELWLLAASYIRYRHGSVTWKGRLVNAQPSRSDALQISE